MKYIFLGDITGKVWRRVVEALLPKYIEKYKPDYIFANSENLSGWKWIKINYLNDLHKLWIKAFTWGNHTFKNKEIFEELEKRERQLRPCNLPEELPWKWYLLIDDKVLLINAMWNVFMKYSVACPFKAVKKIIEMYKDRDLEIIVDFHAETTSEKKAFAYYLDGLASVIVWTHTHVQTSDAQILPEWTWNISDLWMCGPADSILWVKKEIIIDQMITTIWVRHEMSSWKWEFSGAYFEVENGKCVRIEGIFERE